MDLPKIKYGFIFNGHMWINLLKIKALEIFDSKTDNDWDYERVGSEGPPIKTTYTIYTVLDGERFIVMDGIETKAEAEEKLMDILEAIWGFTQRLNRA